MKFKELGVQENIVKALQEDGIFEATPIQERAIPLALEGKDVIGMSRTGSGKTCAFGVPILEKIQKGKGVQALVLCPTRELAVQISKEIEKWGKHMGITCAMIFGGVPIDPQVKRLRRAEVVVGTAGRVLDHLDRGTLDCSRLTCFVLDEADKMVEMGFIQDIERIFSYTPNGRQVLLFGATLSEEINSLQRKYMKNPVVAKTVLQVDKDLLEQYYYDVSSSEKFSLLVHLLQKEETNRVMIFCSTRRTCEIVASNLRRYDIKADMLHGKLNQNKRLRIIEGFNKRKNAVLVASAVAARGLHIDNVSHVINYDLSRDPQEYIHRVGRTARAGESGKAITLLGPRDHGPFSEINHKYHVDIKKLDKPQFARLRFNAREDMGTSRFGGGRGYGRGHGRSQGRGGFRSGGGSGFRSGGRPRFERRSERRSESKWDR